MGKRRKVFLGVMIFVVTVVLLKPVTVLSANGTTELLTPGHDRSSESPSLAVDSDGNVHVAWADRSDISGADLDFDIFYKELVHDVAIINIVPSAATVGETVYIVVTARNKGTFNKTFTVNASYMPPSGGRTLIGDPQTIENLAPGASEDLTFTWDTTDLDAGTYEIGAEASVVAGEIKTDDNTFEVDFTLLPITSSISLSLSETTVTVGEVLTISGSITPTREGVTVTIEYGSNDEWTPIDTVTTDVNGEYTYDWLPPKSGSYSIRASWEGDSITASAESNERILQIGGKPFPIEYIMIIIAAIAIIAAVLTYYFKKLRPIGKLRITADKTEILADGESKSAITVQLQDRKGNPMEALTETEVKLTATGGKLESEVAKIPKGKDAVQIVLASSTEAGTVTLKAKGKRLTKDKIKINFLEKTRFCMGCGTKMSREATRAGACQNCSIKVTYFRGSPLWECKECEKRGNETHNPRNAKFCPKCGAARPSK